MDTLALFYCNANRPNVQPWGDISMEIGFPPVMQRDARVLILGTMPSVLSLSTGQYYGNPQNTFWRILFALWDEPLPSSYEERTRFIKSKRIALWDVLQCCERQGSADSAIVQEKPNDFLWLSSKCPELRAVVFNSRNAQNFYKKLVHPDPFAHLDTYVLPSTSPARAMKFERKFELWKPLRDIIEQKSL